MEERKVAVTDSIWRADRPFILHQTRMEMANLALGPTERYKVFTEIDTQLQNVQDSIAHAVEMAMLIVTPARRPARSNHLQEDDSCLASG